MSTTSPYKSHGGFGRLRNALKFSLQGFKAAFQHEAAFRQELLLAVVLTPAAFWVGSSAIQTLLLISAIVFVLIVEILNSALEALADSITIEHHVLVGRAKDLGSAAVMLSLLLASLIWVTVLCLRFH
ncbi:MAG: diacylglycerol kinase [Paralcaligenes sp.]